MKTILVVLDGLSYVVALLLVVLLLPLAATLVYALSTTWGATILPQGFQLKWFVDLWRDLDLGLLLFHANAAVYLPRRE